MANYDLIVVGAGAIGLSAAYSATQRGLKTLLIDKSTVYNDQCSSKGYERMFRMLYSQQERVRLVESSYAMWNELERATQEKILIEDNILFFGDPNFVTFEGNLNDIRKSMEQLGIPTDYLGSPAEIQNRFPVFQAAGMPSNYIGLTHKIGATIDVQASKRAFLTLSRATGNLTLSEGRNVNQIEYAAGQWSINDGTKNDTSTYLIVCPGINVNSVLSDFGLQASTSDKPWQIWVMTLGFVEGLSQASNLPIWYEFGANESVFYGFPDVGLNPGGSNQLKVAADYTKTLVTNPDDVDFHAPDQAILSAITARLKELFIADVYNTAGPMQNTAVCCYSMSPDGDMVIGKIPTAPEATTFFPNASIFCMGSGRAFKFTPLWGRVLVDLAVDGQSPGYKSDLAQFASTRAGIFETIS